MTDDERSLGALHDRIHPTSGRLLGAVSVDERRQWQVQVEDLWAKVAQLTQERDALRKKVTSLRNASATITGLFHVWDALEDEGSPIEECHAVWSDIMHALEKLKEVSRD